MPRNRGLKIEIVALAQFQYLDGLETSVLIKPVIQRITSYFKITKPRIY